MRPLATSSEPAPGSQKAFAALAVRIKALCAETMALDRDETAPDCVAQLNIQLFALTSRGDGPNKE